MVKLNKAFFTIIFVLVSISPCFCTVTQTSAPPTVGCGDIFTTTIAGTNYQWDFGPNSYEENLNGAGYQSAPVQFLTAGTRTVYVTVTTGGGPVVDSLVVTVQPSASNISISASGPLCSSTSITYTATPTTYTQYAFFVNDSLYQLSPANTFQANLPNGDSVRVFGLSGTCFSNASQALYINTPPPPTLISSVPSDTICGNQLIIFTALPDTYDIYNFFVGGSLLQQSSSNIYSTTQIYNQNIVHVTAGKNGCTSPYWSNSDTITVKATPAITISANSTICQGTPVTVTTVVTQAPVDTFYFYVNSTLVENTTNSSYTSVSLNNNDTIRAIAEYQGCPSRLSDSIVMTVNPIPQTTLSGSSANDTICQGTSVTFTALPTGYTSYDFFNNGQSVQNGSSSTYTSSSLANNDSIYVVATNIGCIGPPSDTVPTTVFPLPTVSTLISGMACVSSTADTLTGYSPPTGGTWSGTGIINDSVGVMDPAQAGVGTYPLVYTYQDPNTGCSNSSTMNFTVNALPVISVTPVNPSICQNLSIQLTASGADAYQWSPGSSLNDSLIPNPVATPAQNTTYTITGVNQTTGCVNSTTETVSISPGPTAAFTFSQACQRQATDFNSSTTLNATTYEWVFGDGTTSTLSDPSHSYVTSDTFNVMLIAGSGGCFDTTTQPVFVYPAATAAFDAFPLYTYNDSNSPVHFINQSTGAQSYTWNFGDQNTSNTTSPYHYYANPGLYTVTLVANNQYGCDDSITKVDYVTIYQAPIVYIPNAFTPGKPGNNDILHIYTPDAKYVDFRIFDRLGEMVYSSTSADSENPGEGWNGTFKGKNAPAGVYVYIAQIVFDDNTSREYQGSITLLR